VNAIVGVTKTQLEDHYMESPLDSTNIGNANFTYSMIVDNMLAVIGTIIRAYASVPNHPLRSFNTSQTANITNRALIPSTDSTSKPIVGVYGAITDASTGKILTKQPMQLIESLLVGIADTSVKGTYFYYDIAEGRLIHTVTNAKIDVVTFDMATQLALVASNGDAPIPDALFDLAWTGLVASLVVDDEFAQQAGVYGAYFQGELGTVKSGASSIAPAPQLASSASPVGS